MDKKKLKTIKLVSCGVCAFMYVAALVMLFLGNFEGGGTALAFSTLASLVVLWYLKSLKQMEEASEEAEETKE